MTQKKILKLFIVLACSLVTGIVHAQNPINWTANQLMEPSRLAETIQTGKAVPVLFSVGPGSLIPNSIDIGMVQEKENLEKFKAQLKKLSKDTDIVIYCGCCPYEHCPNVRPAMALLGELKFKNYHLLDLPHNLKKDWIDKGYPTVKK